MEQKQLWKPNYKTELLAKNSGGALIRKAGELCKSRFKEPIINNIVDSIGLVGFQTKSFILCAKEKPYGWVVSCHEALLRLAIQNQVPLVMYIGSTDKFYKFNPTQCLKIGKLNERAGKRMRNFSIKLGVDYGKEII